MPRVLKPDSPAVATKVFARAEPCPLDVMFGAPEAVLGHTDLHPALTLPVSWLGGEEIECLFPETNPIGIAHGCAVRMAGELMLGCAIQPIGSSIRIAARDLYARIIAATLGQQLYRVWNYVPQINATSGGVENYQAFCAGRAESFELALGPGFKRRLPSASAVGCGGDSLVAVFAAGRATPRHIENPEQVPAYEYPREHGPKPPSFSRASVVLADGRKWVFVSGTAAIKGHHTVAPDALEPQLACTLDNLRIVGRAAGLGRELGRGSRYRRFLKVYVRHATDYPAVRAYLERELLQSGDRVIYLYADICRSALQVEVELTAVETD